MKKFSHLQQWIPEIYMVVSVLFYWFSTSTLLNPFAIGLLLVLSLIIWRKASIPGVIFSFVFLILNIYMILALVSELNDFPVFNNDARMLAIGGGLYIALNLLLSSVMLVKWATRASQSLTGVSAEQAS